jgi:hypothetical protein
MPSGEDGKNSNLVMSCKLMSAESPLAEVQEMKFTFLAYAKRQPRHIRPHEVRS